MRDAEKKKAHQKAYYERNKERLRSEALARQMRRPVEERRADVFRWREANAERYRELKKLQDQRWRLCHGMTPRKHDAHVRLWREMNAAAAAIHDDHVVAFGRTPEGKRWRSRMNNFDLTDGYVKRRLCKNFPALRREAIPRSLIEAERARLLLMRDLRGKP